MSSIFISYRRIDSEDVTGRIFDSLKSRFAEQRLFKDVNNIPLGTDFWEQINKAVSVCNVLLAIIGREWASAKDESGNRRLFDKTDFVRLELEAALAREIPVIPVLVRRASMPKPEELPESLKAVTFRNAIQVRSDPDYDVDIKRLIAGIESIVGSNGVSTQLDSNTSRHPLHAFPRGPRVDDTLVSPHLIETYAKLNSSFTDASNLLRRAVQQRRQADPGDNRVTVPEMADLPNIGYVGATSFWTSVFLEACNHGPRMLAALLQVQPNDQFDDAAQQDRESLLQHLRDLG